MLVITLRPMKSWYQYAIRARWLVTSIDYCHLFPKCNNCPNFLHCYRAKSGVAQSPNLYPIIIQLQLISQFVMVVVRIKKTHMLEIGNRKLLPFKRIDGRCGAPAGHLYFVSPQERPWRQRVFRVKTLVIAHATCVLSHAIKKEHRDWRIKDASCSVYPWARSVTTSRSFSWWDKV